MINPDLIRRLPRFGHTITGRPMEPMNLVFLGPQERIRQTFRAAGWYESTHISPFTLLRALVSIIFDRPYPNGPVTSVIVDGRVQDLSFQKPTPINKFRRRHHLRIWQTKQKYKGLSVWISQVSFDKRFKATSLLRFPPAHRIDSDIDNEREFVVRDITAAGAKHLGNFQLQPSFEGVNGYKDSFQTDGKAAVIEV